MNEVTGGMLCAPPSQLWSKPPGLEKNMIPDQLRRKGFVIFCSQKAAKPGNFTHPSMSHDGVQHLPFKMLYFTYIDGVHTVC